MPKKLAKEKIQGIKDTFLLYPTKSDREIAKEFKVGHVKVSELRNEMAKYYDTEFSSMTAAKFIQQFQIALDYWTSQIGKLEERKTQMNALLDEKVTIFKKAEEGHFYPEEVDQSPQDKLKIHTEIAKIEKQQSELKEKILKLASMGEVKAVIKMMKNGRIKQLIIPSTH